MADNKNKNKKKSLIQNFVQDVSQEIQNRLFMIEQKRSGTKDQFTSLLKRSLNLDTVVLLEKLFKDSS